MAKSIDLMVKIITDAKQGAAGLREAQSGFEKFAGKVDTAAVGAAAALGAIQVAMIANAKAAASEAQSQALLAKQMRLSAGATEETIRANEEFLRSMERASGVADETLRPAMASLVRTTGDVALSQQALGLALDISAATGRDVEAVTGALSKGYAGNTKAIARMVPGLDKAVVASGDMEKISAELAEMMGGSSAAAAETAAGKWDTLGVVMQDLKETSGAALLPMMEDLAETLMKVADWVTRNQEAFSKMVKGVMLLSGAIIALNLALKVAAVVQGVMNLLNNRAVAAQTKTTVATQAQSAATAKNTVVTKLAAVAQRLWNAAMKANPIMWVIAAVIALVAAIIWLWNNCEWFQNFVLKMWELIKAGTKVAADFIKRVFGVVWEWLSAKVRQWSNVAKAAFNVVKSVATVVANVIRAIWNVVMTVIGTKIKVWSTIAKVAFNAVKAVAQAVANFVKSVWERTFGRLTSIASSLGAKLAAPFNYMRDAVSRAIGMVQELINKIKNIKMPKISIPGLSSAGLSAATGVSQHGATTTAATGGNTVINIYGATDPEGTARQIRRILNGHDRRMGGLTGAGLRTGLV